VTHFHPHHIGGAAGVAGWGEVEVLGHGEPVTRDAAAELREAARRLPAETSEHG
jgi:glyoxylase-like metal-dependent hydrolase (beta-lactamase superfamily II)